MGVPTPFSDKADVGTILSWGVKSEAQTTQNTNVAFGRHAHGPGRPYSSSFWGFRARLRLEQHGSAQDLNGAPTHICSTNGRVQAHHFYPSIIRPLWSSPMSSIWSESTDVSRIWVPRKPPYKVSPPHSYHFRGSEMRQKAVQGKTLLVDGKWGEKDVVVSNHLCGKGGCSFEALRVAVTFGP